MKKSKKIILYGLIVSILYIMLCIYLYNNRDKDDTTIPTIPNPNEEIALDSSIDLNDIDTQATLDYKIENGVVSIAGVMPILDNDDSLKQSMMRFCSDEYCDRTIVFSSNKEIPYWKNLAKDIITLFYEENLTNASFEADEYGNITVSGELLTQKSKDKIAEIIKKSNINHVKNNTHLKLIRFETPINDIESIKGDNNKIDTQLEDNTTIPDYINIAQDKISQLLSINKIHFYRNRAKITRGGKKVLNKIIKIIKETPDVKVIVKGYTDASGKRDINRWISSERAKSVKNYLGSHGINPRDIEAKGFGEDDLLYEDRPYSPLNRRVEIEIKRK